MIKNTFSAPSQRLMMNENRPPPSVEGHNEAIKEDVKEDEKSEMKLDSLLNVSDRVLFRTQAVFPFDLFPNEITIDINQVNILYNHFLSRRVHSIAIKNIFDVSVNSGILFASLQIVDAGYKGESPIEINYLQKRAALEARQIIQGLVITSKEDLDLYKLGINKNKLEILGEATGIDQSFN